MEAENNTETRQAGEDDGSIPLVGPPAGVRKRTRRACDRCSALRVRCDGLQPCRRCQEYDQSCYYARSMRRRGRKPGSRKPAERLSRFNPRQEQDDETHYGESDSSGAHLDSGQGISSQHRPQYHRHQQEQYEQEGSVSQTASQRGINYDDLASTHHTITASSSGGHFQASSTDLAMNGHIPGSSDTVPSELMVDTTMSVAASSTYTGNQHHSVSSADLEFSTMPVSSVIAENPGPQLHGALLSIGSHCRDEAPQAENTTHSVTVDSLLNSQMDERYGSSSSEILGAASAARTTLREPEVDGNRACRFKCLEPIIPMLQGIIDAKLACELLDLYFVEPGGSLFRCSSPYVLAHIVRKESLLRSANPRRSTPALMVTMLWVSAQTAESSLFLLPGQKSRVCEELRRLMMALIKDRDPDFWHRTTEGLLLNGLEFTTKAAMTPGGFNDASMYEHERPSCVASEPPPAPSVDDVLTFILITIVVSGGDFKADCFRWWNKALSLSHKMRLNREDATQKNMSSTEHSLCTRGRTSSTCACRTCEAVRTGLSVPEIQEERRRAFWLIFCLDRHLALSFNSPLRILDDECQLYAPMPDEAWESLSLPKSPITTNHDPEAANGTQQEQRHLGRSFGAPTRVVGIGFFEYFLPLMTILGDIIQLHRRKSHPRFGNLQRSKSTPINGVAQDNQAHEGHDRNIEGDPAYLIVEKVMSECAQSIVDLAIRYDVDALNNAGIPASQVRTPNSTGFAPRDEENHSSNSSHAQISVDDAMDHRRNNDTVDASRHQSLTTTHRHHAQAQLVTAYSTFIINVLHVLLHGKWDAVSMLDNEDGWIPSVGFMKCASHAIAASDAVSRILACDPELSFMPYLFGIYLLHGSFILLLFADRMPQIGLNESVERACEIIIRAHEVCVVTLSTEFQKHFRKVLRSTLYSVRSAGTSSMEESKARRRALSLYRWNDGSTGLAL